MTMQVERRELAPGLTISRILTGLWQIADMERSGWQIDLESAAAAMRLYADAGLTSFDMADHYGSAEEIVGSYCQRWGGDGLEIATKWVPEPGPISRSDVRRAVERALGRLRVEAIDLLQFHAWSYSDPSYLDGLFYLQDLQREGLIRHLGLTNFDTDHLNLVLSSGLEVVSNQVCFSLLDRRAAGAMSELCRRSGVRLLAYGTLAGGLLSDRYLGQPEPEDSSTWSEMKYRRFLDVVAGWSDFQGLLEVLSGIARRHGVSIANVASRYVLQQPTVAGIIIGARLGESEHIEENLRLFTFALGTDDLREIESALEGFGAVPGDCGDEYRRPPFLTASGDLSHHVREFPAPYEVRGAADSRRRVVSGTRWEEAFGYCRAIRVGRRILVSGTTASHGDRLIGGSDPAAQASFCFDKVEGAIRSLGGRLEDVVRTRVFVADPGCWEAVAQVHGQRFRHIQPANTLVLARLVGEEYLVEVEAEAVVSD